MLKLQTIVASTRPGRAGLSIGTWFNDVAAAHKDFQAGLIDLKAVNLPMFDEPHHPRMRQYVHQHTKDWSATVSRADAFVFVVPEYNHSINAATKNAIDYLHNEWRDKAVGLVTYGGVSGGTRALVALKPILGSLRMVAVTDSVNIPFFAQFIDDDGVFHPNDVSAGALTAMLDEIARYTTVLGPLREGA